MSGASDGLILGVVLEENPNGGVTVAVASDREWHTDVSVDFETLEEAQLFVAQAFLQSLWDRRCADRQAAFH